MQRYPGHSNNGSPPSRFFAWHRAQSRLRCANDQWMRRGYFLDGPEVLLRYSGIVKFNPPMRFLEHSSIFFRSGFSSSSSRSLRLDDLELLWLAALAITRVSGGETGLEGWTVAEETYFFGRYSGWAGN